MQYMIIYLIIYQYYKLNWKFKKIEKLSNAKNMLQVKDS